MLEPYRQSQNPERQQRSPSPDEIEGEESYVINEGVDSKVQGRGCNKRVVYYVLWEGFNPLKATWESLENLEETGLEKLRKFHRRNSTTVPDSCLNH